ncbi:MAG: hypothetical protein AB1486_28750 [Planctomycetota bacterium]
MNREALDLWDRTLEALQAADAVVAVSPDAAASRAYYVAFYAVAAHFAAGGKTFTKHSAAEAQSIGTSLGPATGRLSSTLPPRDL